MPILPLFNQFVLPTLVSLYAVLASFFPQTVLHTKPKVVTVAEKKIASPTPSESPTPTGKEKVVLHTSQQTFSDGLVSSDKKENKDSTLPNSNVSATSVPTNPPISQTVTATTTISASGKTIHLIMKYPSIGGNITGTMSGDCSGTISGIYDGPSTQTLSGKGSASCPIGFISIPVDITYSGKLLSSTDAQITYSVNALSKTDSGNTTLSLSQ